MGYGSDIAIALDENSWAYTDDTPGTLTETCSNPPRTQVFALPPSGIIHFNQYCTYNVINGPFHEIKPYIRQLTYNTVIEKESKEKPRNLVKDLTSLQQHFKDNGYIYLMTTSILLFLLTSTGCFFCVNKVRRRRQRRRRQVPRVRWQRASEEDYNPAIVQMRPPVATLQYPRTLFSLMPSTNVETV